MNSVRDSGLDLVSMLFACSRNTYNRDAAAIAINDHISIFDLL